MFLFLQMGLKEELKLWNRVYHAPIFYQACLIGDSAMACLDFWHHNKLMPFCFVVHQDLFMMLLLIMEWDAWLKPNVWWWFVKHLLSTATTALALRAHKCFPILWNTSIFLLGMVCNNFLVENIKGSWKDKVCFIIIFLHSNDSN